MTTVHDKNLNVINVVDVSGILGMIDMFIVMIPGATVQSFTFFSVYTLCFEACSRIYSFDLSICISFDMHCHLKV